MSKIVFINPAPGKMAKGGNYHSTILESISKRTYSYIPNLCGLILAALTPDKHTFVYLDEEIEDIDYDEPVDLVAITAMSFQANRAYQISSEFKKRGVTVVMGGIHASIACEETLEHCDAIAVGEGENSWPALLEDFENGVLKRQYRAGDYPPVETLVSPRYDILKHEHYLAYPIQATRGCPYSCDFCSIKHASGHRYRMRDIKDVINDIKEAEKYNGGNVAGVEKKAYFFVDDNLYVNREYNKALFAAMAELSIVWDGQGTVNTARDEEVVKLMAASGCRSFNFGFESVSAESLKEANKPKINVVEEYNAVIDNLQKYGIAAGGFFIMGFDGDEVTVFRETLEFIKEFNLFQAGISVLTPYPGTELYKRIDGEGRIFNRDWMKYNSWNCVFTPKRMSPEELQMGFEWLVVQVTSLEHVREVTRRFWENASQSSKPTLRLIERLAIILVAAFKIRGKAYKPHRKFLYWAARHPKASDFRFIFWTALRNEFTSKISGHADPAELRLKNQAESGARLGNDGQTRTRTTA
ncbi:MAG: B12-binding domain-containing radical SAM protein [Clostridiales Family XIII bacterium]|jgi:radical SAM superfamily enzyme YgiQ (UPF0313 family)|nr:B12-binding domain-containing radical SAM protein [Clostridiales Family XIII bacterium]